MKIINRGVPPSEKPYTSKCGHCKTEIEFVESEARIVDDRGDTCLVVECPVCRKDIWKSKGWNR